MPYVVISNETLKTGNPLHSATVRVLRDNVSELRLGTSMTVNIPRITSANNSSYCRIVVANVVPTGGTLMNILITSSSGIGGQIDTLRANGNSSGGINLSCVVTGSSSSATVTFTPVIGLRGGLTT